MARLVHETQYHSCAEELRSLGNPYLGSIAECSCGNQFIRRDDQRDGYYWEQLRCTCPQIDVGTRPLQPETIPGWNKDCPIHRTAQRADKPKTEKHGYTRHGHPCCNACPAEQPPAVARCGGIGLCPKCQMEAAYTHTGVKRATE